MPLQIQDQPDTLDEMKNQDVPAFTHKLRRVMAGKSRKDAAIAVRVPVGTLQAWLTQGNQPRPEQAAMLADFAGCTVTYLCDPTIPVDADPKEGGGVALSDGELVARLRERYIEEAERLHDYLDEIQGIDWHDIGRRLLSGHAPKLLKGENPGTLPPDIERAAEVLTAMRVLVPHTIGPFLPVFNADSVDERLRPDALKRRMDGLAYAQTVRLVMDLLPNLRGLAAALRRGTEHDTSGVAKLCDELRTELQEHEASGAHLLETCAGVLEAGGVEAYAALMLERARALMKAKAKAGEIEVMRTDTPADLVPVFVGLIPEVVKDDIARQGSFEVKADQTWRHDAAIKAGTTPTPDPDLQSRIVERGKQRAVLMAEAFAAHLQS
ncbi:MAG: hypothetical protein AAGA29_03625 [Planctomycetota bacterium]